MGNCDARAHVRSCQVGSWDRLRLCCSIAPNSRVSHYTFPGMLPKGNQTVARINQKVGDLPLKWYLPLLVNTSCELCDATRAIGASADMIAPAARIGRSGCPDTNCVKMPKLSSGTWSWVKLVSIPESPSIGLSACVAYDAWHTRTRAEAVLCGRADVREMGTSFNQTHSCVMNQTCRIPLSYTSSHPTPQINQTSYTSSHPTPQINQTVVNTTHIPVNVKLCLTANFSFTFQFHIEHLGPSYALERWSCGLWRGVSRCVESTVYRL